MRNGPVPDSFLLTSVLCEPGTGVSSVSGVLSQICFTIAGVSGDVRLNDKNSSGSRGPGCFVGSGKSVTQTQNGDDGVCE